MRRGPPRSSRRFRYVTLDQHALEGGVGLILHSQALRLMLRGATEAGHAKVELPRKILPEGLPGRAGLITAVRRDCPPLGREVE